MNKKIQDAINKQINMEIFSSYLYLSMAAYFDGKSLAGCSNWMKVQAEEEMSHTMKFYNYLYERGGEVILQPIEGPQTKFNSPIDAFSNGLAHEKLVTSLINNLYELGQIEKDYAFQSFLQWFIDEQVEEEANATAIIDRLKLAGEQGPGLFMIDKELAARVFVDDTKKA